MHALPCKPWSAPVDEWVVQPQLFQAKKPSYKANLGQGLFLGEQIRATGSPGLSPESIAGAGSLELLGLNAGKEWVNQGSLQPDSPVYKGRFGSAVAIIDGMLLVGVPGAEAEGKTGAGNVMLFTQSGGKWKLKKIIQSPAPTYKAGFGASIVAIREESGAPVTLLVGEPGFATGGKARAGGVLELRMAPDGSATLLRSIVHNPEYDGKFGASLAYDGVHLYVGASGVVAGGKTGAGAVFVFDRTAGNWKHNDTLTASKPSFKAHFGSALAAQEGALLVGASGEAAAGITGSGAVYLIEATEEGAFIESARLTPSKVGYMAHFGSGLALYEETLAVGASGATAGGITGAGSVTQYEFLKYENRLTPVITWQPPAPVFYGERLGQAQLGASTGVAGKFIYDPPKGTLLDAGTYKLKVTFTPTDGDVYKEADANVTLLVSKTPLAIVAEDKKRVYGEANPPLTIRYDGFVNGEGAGVLLTKPTLSTMADAKSKPGVYVITIAGGTAKNYAIKLQHGTLKVYEPELVAPGLAGVKVVRIGQKVSFKFSFNRQALREYTIQRSANLVEWTNDGPPIPALDAASVYRFSRTIDTGLGEDLFFRVIVE